MASTCVSQLPRMASAVGPRHAEPRTLSHSALRFSLQRSRPRTALPEQNRLRQRFVAIVTASSQPRPKGAESSPGEAWDPLNHSAKQTESFACTANSEHLTNSELLTPSVPPSTSNSAGVAASPQPWLLLTLGGLVSSPGLDLSGPGSVLEAVGVLALIVAVHEAGHFLAARSLGIHVTKFAVGFGPTIFKYQAKSTPLAAGGSPKPRAQWFESFRLRSAKGKSAARQSQDKRKAALSNSTATASAAAAGAPSGVEYSLRLFPLGGYVAFPEDDESNSIFAKDDPDLLRNRPLADRIIVVSAGVIANVIFAFTLLFAQVNTVGLLVQQFQPGVLVPHVIPGGAGERGGLKDGDVILEVQGKKLPASEIAVTELVNVIKEQPNRPVELLVSKNDVTRKVFLKPDEAVDGTGRINVQLSLNVEPSSLKARNPLEGVFLAGHEMTRLSGLVFDGLGQLLSNFNEAAERLSGPVGIVAVGAEVARTNLAALLQFAAIVNLNLAIVNILPLPALDGGFLLLLVVEGLRGGKRIPQDVERAIMSSGLLLLLTAGIFLIVRDTINLAAFL